MSYEKMIMAIALLLSVFSMVLSLENRYQNRIVASVDVQMLIREEIDHSALLHLNPAQRATRASWFSATLKSALQKLAADHPEQLVLVAPAVLAGSADRTDWVRTYLGNHEETGAR